MSATTTRPAAIIRPLSNGPSGAKWSIELVFRGSSSWTGGPVSDLSLSPFGDPADRSTVAQWAAVSGYRLVDEDQAQTMRAEALEDRKREFLRIILANDLLPEPNAELRHIDDGPAGTEAERYALEAADPTVPGHTKVLAWFRAAGFADQNGNPVR